MPDSRKAVRLQKLMNIDIYPVTCEPLSNGRADLEVLEAVLAGGAKIVQLRDKHATKRDLFQKAKAFRRITADRNALLIVNDHLDVALAVDADGAHLGQSDLPVSRAGKIAPDLLIGASTHNLEEALKAQTDGADYVNIGPIFSTQTKEGVCGAVGPELVSEIAPCLKIPFTVMGGVKMENIDQVLERGARRIAVVTAITAATDIAAATSALRKKITSYSTPSGICPPDSDTMG